MGNISLLECVPCSETFEPAGLRTTCHCGAALRAAYDFSAIRARWDIELLSQEPHSQWRYHPVLPAESFESATLGEGWTQLIRVAALGRAIDLPDLWIKDESRNPTGSCHARGASVVVTMAKKLGLGRLRALASGDLACALAAYAALAGVEADISMPLDVPQSSFLESKAYGARVKLGAKAVPEPSGEQVWDVNASGELFRIEGQKTAAYELVEQFNWEVPDAIICPCADGIMLVAMWKAFGELQKLGWIGSKKPKMVAVQAAARTPGARSFEPSPESWVLKALRESGGTAIEVSDEQSLDDALLLARSEGIFAAPETGACIAALRHLLTTGFLNPAERIVLYNVASGLRRTETFSTRFPRRGASEQDKLGGLILPR